LVSYSRFCLSQIGYLVTTYFYSHFCQIKSELIQVSFLSDRKRFRSALNLIFKSRYADSSGVSSRNSLAEPIFHPFFASLSRLSLRIIIFLQSFLTDFNHSFRCLIGLLAEHVQKYNRIIIDPIHNPPRALLIIDPQFMTFSTNTGHWPGLRHAEELTTLQRTEQETCFKSGRLREGRGLHLSMQPNEWFVASSHRKENMSHMTYSNHKNKQPNTRQQHSLRRAEAQNR